MIWLFIQRTIAIWFAFLIVLFQKTMYTMEKYQSPSKKSRTREEVLENPSHFNTLPKELIEKIASLVAKTTPSGFNDLSNFINTCKTTRNLIDPTEIVRSIKTNSVDLFYEISEYLAMAGRHPSAMHIFAQILPLFNTGTDFYNECLTMYQQSHDRISMLYALKKMELLARAGFFKQAGGRLLENNDRTESSIKTIMPEYIEIIRNIPQEIPKNLSSLSIEQYPLYRTYAAFFKLEEILSEGNVKEISTAAQLIRSNALNSIDEKLEPNDCSSFLETLSNSDPVKNNRAAICQLLEKGSLSKHNFDQNTADHITVIEFLAKQLQNNSYTFD